MRAVNTGDLSPLTMPSSETEKLWLYNGLDCCVTLEVLEAIRPQLDSQTRSTYEFSKSLQAPCLEMKLRGVRINPAKRSSLIKAYKHDLEIIEKNLTRILKEGLDLELNWRSNQQLLKLFYEVLKLPVIKKRNSKGVFAPTVDRNALERLEIHFNAQIIIRHLLSLRDIGKKIGVLETDIDADGRMRTSYNIAGTNTGRFSSSFSDFGTGTNFQNIEDRLREIFVSDPGYKFAYIDLEQAESRVVGAIQWNLFNDGRYLDACESGDLHTAVCRLAWTDLPWTGDLAKDREIAEQPFYRQHSFRHMAKILGHGTNYRGTPFTMAKHTKLDAKIIAEFQAKYFTAFPGHQRWHGYVATELYTTGRLDTLTGRRRWFFGRRSDDTTIREAIAYSPQGSVGDILNRGMLAVWRLHTCQLLMQIHDAILIQYPEETESIVIPKVIAAIRQPIELNNGRTLIIPSDAQVGWNWAKATKENPHGLVKWKGSDDRGRPKEVNVLDRLFP